MIDPESRQAVLDEEHLRLLSIGYVISGTITGVFSLFGLLYAVLGLMLGVLVSATSKGAGAAQAAPPDAIGWIFGIFGGVFFLVLACIAAAKFRTAYCIKKRKGRTFCTVIAALSCLGIPYGTCLGVFTFIVLGRPGVGRLFRG